MKTIVSSLILALSLLCGQAFAATQVFTSPAGKFSIDVPEGWTAKAVDKGCQLTDAKGENSMSLQYRKADVEPKVLAKAVVEGMNGKLKKETAEQDGTVCMVCDVNGVQVMVVVAPVEDILTCAILGGSDTQSMLKILQSVEEVK